MLKTPRVSSSFIYNLLDKKESWIRLKLDEFKNKTLLDKNIIEVDSAKLYMAQRVDYFAAKMGLKYNELKFRRMKRRWGSCSSKKNITLNLYLYNTSNELIDYVIVHELAHLVHMNHSKRFHNLVKKYIFNSIELEKKLQNFNL
mgnify:CR=1 FL=1